MDYVFGILRQIAFFFDSIVYSFIEKVYELVIYLANMDLVSNNAILGQLISRVYLLLGIFMLFRVSFSILQYIINPGAFSETGKGFGKLVTNLMVSVVLLVTVPFIFDKLYDFQGIILRSNVINNLILGSEFVSETNENISDQYQQVKSMSRDLQFAVFGAFYTLRTDAENGIPDCNFSGDPENPVEVVVGSREMAKDKECMNAFATAAEEPLSNNGGKLINFFKTMDGDVVYDNRDFSGFASLLWWKNDGASTFVIHYTPIISTITGAYLLFLLITFCINIAARAIKLMFLEAVAPIAIVSYIDPKESASQGKLHNWAIETLKTFFSLFLRLAMIFLAIKLIQMLTSMIFSPVRDNYIDYYNDLDATNTPVNMFIYIFLILGIFTFAKQAPQLIEKIFGIKSSGEFSMNPLKNINENAGATAFIGGAVGAGVTGISSMATARANGKSGLGMFKSGVTGLGVGAFRGGKGGFGKNAGEAVKAGMRSGGISARNMLMRRDLGINYRKGNVLSSLRRSAGMRADSFLDKTGGPDLFQMQDAEVQRLEKYSEAAGDLATTVKDKAANSIAMYKDNKSYQAHFRELQAREWKLEQDVRNGVDLKDEKGNSTTYEAQKAKIEKDKKAINAHYYMSALKGELVDSKGKQMRDFDVENKYKDVMAKRELLSTKGEDLRKDIDASKVASDDIDAQDTIYTNLLTTKYKASDAAQTIQSSDSYRTHKQQHETRKNVNQERFYENR